MRMILLACLLLVGCGGAKLSSSSSGYLPQAEACVKAAQAWTAEPKNKGLVVKAYQKCETTVKTYANSDAASRKSYANLVQLKASLETARNTLADGGNPESVDSMSSVSLVDGVKIVTSMLETEVANENRQATATP